MKGEKGGNRRKIQQEKQGGLDHKVCGTNGQLWTDFLLSVYSYGKWEHLRLYQCFPKWGDHWKILSDSKRKHFKTFQSCQDGASGLRILAALSTSLSVGSSGGRAGRKLCERIFWCHNFWVLLEHLIIIPLAVPAFPGRSVEAIDLFTSTGVRLGLFRFSVNYAFSVWDSAKEVSSGRGRFFNWAGAWTELQCCV